ncbi:MAG: 1-acyl-sn-glycerol-3-phosphate acyltransferase [Legionellaceae bacterium]|nr:1-acyl-sn-glycerol-3-phosphate acyltransferase [Legionellaceae bacterium]
MRRFSQWILYLWGWKIVGNLPPIKKFVLIVAPHTSNWDLIIGLLGRFSENRMIHFLAKQEIFVFPFRGLLKKLGGIPVDRSHPHHRVEQIVERFQQTDELILGITPEGTRSPVKRWKFGFYHIAHQAGVPIVMVGLDYGSKEIRIAPPLQCSGDLKKDFTPMLAFFKTIKGRHPKDIPDAGSD